MSLINTICPSGDSPKETQAPRPDWTMDETRLMEHAASGGLVLLASEAFLAQIHNALPPMERKEVNGSLEGPVLGAALTPDGDVWNHGPVGIKAQFELYAADAIVRVAADRWLVDYSAVTPSKTAGRSGVIPLSSPDSVLQAARLIGLLEAWDDELNEYQALCLLGQLASASHTAPERRMTEAGGVLTMALRLLDRAWAPVAGPEGSATGTDAIAKYLGIGAGGIARDGALGRLPPQSMAVITCNRSSLSIVTAAIEHVAELATDKKLRAEATVSQASVAPGAGQEEEGDDVVGVSWKGRVLLSQPLDDPGQDGPEIGRWKEWGKNAVGLVMMPEIEALVNALNAEFPWLREANERIGDDLALAAGEADAPLLMRPLLLAGPPGVGKSRYARRLAELAGAPFRSVNVASLDGITTLSGVGRGWRGARACFALQAIRDTGKANPVLLVDELDKAPESREHGSAPNVLLGMIEPETAASFHDAFLLADADLSMANWILAANDASLLPEPLMSRVICVEVTPPHPSAFAAILAGVLRDIAARYRRPLANLPQLSAEVLEELRRRFTAEPSVRVLKAGVTRALGVAARGRSDVMGALIAEVASTTRSNPIGFGR